MLEALSNRQLAARREQHETGDGRWHYMLAHTAPETAPAEDDIVTDLNPSGMVRRPARPRHNYSGAYHYSGTVDSYQGVALRTRMPADITMVMTAARLPKQSIDRLKNTATEYFNHLKIERIQPISI